MKKINLRTLLLLCMLTFTCLNTFAQSYQEVVYLKNGSVVRGVIIEQIPEQSLKIQTADGSIFAYKMSEVEKITKETVGKSVTTASIRQGAVGGSANPFAGINNGTGAKTGYKGFVDLSYGLGTGDFGEDRIEISTTHGKQLSPNFFVGGGAALEYLFDSEVIAVPIFIDGRANLLDNKISPFIDLKIGYSFFDAQGFYLNPTLGCRIGTGGSSAFNLGIGYALQKGKNDYDMTLSKKVICLKIGYEF